jgi:hypothetical protein
MLCIYLWEDECCFPGFDTRCWILQGRCWSADDAVFPLLDTEIFVISSAVGQMFLLVEKVETSEGYDCYVLKGKICSPPKTVEYDVSIALY